MNPHPHIQKPALLRHTATRLLAGAALMLVSALAVV